MKTIFFLTIAFFPFHVFAQTISPNMNMPVPIPGVTPGPDWATDISASLSIVDSHDHSPGKGVQITPAGINISSDLTCNSNNLTSIRSSKYTSQASPLSTGADLNETYVSGVDLYYNDGSGNQIRLTQGGSIVGTAGSISGLPSGTASASYATGTFVFQSATSTPANVDGGSFIFRNTLASSKGVTVSPANALGSNYSLTLPLLPSVQSIMTLDAAGIIGAPYTVDGTSISIISNIIGVAANGIATTNIVNQAVTQNKLAPRSTGSTVGMGGFATSSGSGSYSINGTVASVPVPGLSVTITTTGRPVHLMLLPDGVSLAGIWMNFVSGSYNPAQIQFLRGASLLAVNEFGEQTSNLTVYPPSSFQWIDPVAAGTYTYTVNTKTSSTNQSIFVANAILAAYEL